jgi:alkanesulfonate monooxygenase SsuD/methylene tetrahydromethanopterin reductase-like flavin-dependent oxidoreductase (luciferase family)
MTVTFGVHTGLQNTTIDELRSLWTRIEDLGFDWISIWDHFYSADFNGYECHEAVAAHAALACHTSRVRCGSLVYCAGYRHPAVLANAIATIDHLSGGRADIGIGAGWAFNEYQAYGIPFPSDRERLDILEEAIQCLRLLLREEVANFEGRHFTLTDARCEPKPVQAELPIWVGGRGAKRTPRIAAGFADGWNAAFVSPEEFAQLRNILADRCSEAGRSIDDMKCSVNVGLAFTDDSLRQQFGGLSDMVRPGVLMGSDDQIRDTVGRYVEGGANQVNIAMRAPWLVDDLERLAPVILASR